MAIDYGLTVDKEGFNASMEEARQKARNARHKVIFFCNKCKNWSWKSFLSCYEPMTSKYLFIFCFILYGHFSLNVLNMLLAFHLIVHFFYFTYLVHTAFFCLYFACFFWQAGGNSIVMDANATAQLRNQGLASTDDSPKFMWPKVRCTLNFVIIVAFILFLIQF